MLQCLEPATDVWGFGATLWELSSGLAPWPEHDDFAFSNAHVYFQHVKSNPPDLKGVHAALQSSVAACMQLDPALRPSAAALVSLFEPLAADGVPSDVQDACRRVIIDGTDASAFACFLKSAVQDACKTPSIDGAGTVQNACKTPSIAVADTVQDACKTPVIDGADAVQDVCKTPSIGEADAVQDACKTPAIDGADAVQDACKTPVIDGADASTFEPKIA
jgi:serine/threonine protein kinase